MPTRYHPADNAIAYSSSSQPIAIPANSTVDLPITILNPFVINQLIGTSRDESELISVRLNVTHPFVPDLQADLVAPDRTRVRLFTNVGNLGVGKANFSNSLFDDLGTTPIQLGTAPFADGSYTPQLPLSALNGTPFNISDGVWRLEITNNGSQEGIFTD